MKRPLDESPAARAERAEFAALSVLAERRQVYIDAVAAVEAAVDAELPDDPFAALAVARFFGVRPASAAARKRPAILKASVGKLTHGWSFEDWPTGEVGKLNDRLMDAVFGPRKLAPGDEAIVDGPDELDPRDLRRVERLHARIGLGEPRAPLAPKLRPSVNDETKDFLLLGKVATGGTEWRLFIKSDAARADRLVAAGYLDWRWSPSGQRQKHYRLTAEGRARFDATRLARNEAAKAGQDEG